MSSKTNSGLEMLSSLTNDSLTGSEPFRSIAARFCLLLEKTLKSATGSNFHCSTLSATLGKFNLAETSTDGIVKAFSLGGLNSAGTISIGSKVIYHALEFMLGAKECGAHIKKQITLIESSIGQRVLKAAIKDLGEAIASVYEGVSLHLEQTSKQSSSTIAKLVFSLSCTKYKDELILMLPCEGKCAVLFGQHQDNWYDELAKANLRGEILLEARMSDTRTRDLSEFFNLKAGDTILLDGPIEDGVELGTKEYLIARGKAGDLRGSIGVSISKIEGY